MSEFGERLRKTRSSLKFRCRIPRMTTEDHASGDYELIHSEELHFRYWEPSRDQVIDGKIRRDPEVADKIKARAPADTDAWDFRTENGLIRCDDEGCFIVDYFTLKKTGETQ